MGQRLSSVVGTFGRRAGNIGICQEMQVAEWGCLRFQKNWDRQAVSAKYYYRKH